jgi:hypothetical protein
VSFEGETKVIDFGIAKSALRGTATDPKMGFGKFGYMAPEQLVRGGVVDRRTDLYATGVILYELLTGERLFQFPEGTDYRTIARAVANGQHPLPSQREATLAAFDSVVARALAPDPKNRYPTAEELRDAVQTELARVNPRLTADRLGAFVRQHFEEELTEERSLIREMRAVDLSAYAEELHDAQVHTVSFARGDSQVSKEVGPLAESSDAARTDRTPLPPPTVLTEEAEVATSPTPRPILASQDSSYSHELEPFPRRPSWIIFAVIAAGCLIAGGVLAMTLLRKEPSPGEAQAQVAPLPAEPPRIVVQPMAEEAPAAPAAAVPKMRIEPDTPTPAAVKTDRGHRRARGHREKGKESATGIVDPFTAEVAQAPQAPKADAEAVKRRFLTVKQEYEAFRKQYGGRLDSDYNEILELQTFGGEGKWEKLDAKLAALRKKMADARKSE